MDWKWLRAGLKSLEKGLGSKKGVGLNNSILCYTSRPPELHAKVFPFSAILIQLQSYRLTGHTYFMWPIRLQSVWSRVYQATKGGRCTLGLVYETGAQIYFAHVVVVKDKLVLGFHTEGVEMHRDF